VTKWDSVSTREIFSMFRRGGAAVCADAAYARPPSEKRAGAGVWPDVALRSERGVAPRSTFGRRRGADSPGVVIAPDACLVVPVLFLRVMSKPFAFVTRSDGRWGNLAGALA